MRDEPIPELSPSQEVKIAELLKQFRPPLSPKQLQALKAHVAKLAGSERLVRIVLNRMKALGAGMMAMEEADAATFTGGVTNTPKQRPGTKAEITPELGDELITRLKKQSDREPWATNKHARTDAIALLKSISKGKVAVSDRTMQRFFKNKDRDLYSQLRIVRRR